MTIQQEVYEKIMRLPEDGIKLILVVADEIARQHGILIETDTDKEKSSLLLKKKKRVKNIRLCLQMGKLLTLHWNM